MPEMIVRPIKKVVQAGLGRFGYRLQRIRWTQDTVGFSQHVPLPEGAEAYLTPDNPELIDLQRRYRTVDSPVARHTLWSLADKSTEKTLRYFRGDGMYMWAYRALGDESRRFYIYANHIRTLDEDDLLGTKLTEDGSFGCFTYEFDGFPRVSRDLLDSVNEIYFLDRQCQLLSRPGLRMLDIGAGYGRMAHRILSATENVERYWCIDAVPRSSFLCNYHLRHLGWAGTPDSRAQVVPLDQRDTIKPDSIDLAVNVHSFSEMCYEAIEAWFQWLAELRVPKLFVVPNQPTLLSTEADYSRRPWDDIVERAGYRRIAFEPTLRDTTVRDLTGIKDNFWLFERS